MPSYVFNDAQKPQPEQGQTISKDEVSNVLATYSGSGDSEVTRRIWDKVLLENTDDVVHVLSLKGLFLYLSPSSSRILEYDWYSAIVCVPSKRYRACHERAEGDDKRWVGQCRLPDTTEEEWLHVV
jgi:hypothetical protein